MSTKGVTEYRTARTTERKDKAWRARDYAVRNSDPGVTPGSSKRTSPRPVRTPANSTACISHSLNCHVPVRVL